MSEPKVQLKSCKQLFDNKTNSLILHTSSSSDKIKIINIDNADDDNYLPTSLYDTA